MKKLVLPATALAIGAAFIAAPLAASAATLPDGEAIYGYQSGFYSVNATNAAINLIGSPTAFLGGTYGMDYSNQDGVAYFFVNDTPCEFYSLDITTGSYTDIGPIVDGVVDSASCDALDVAPDGTVRVAAEATIYVIDTATGAATSANVISGDLTNTIGWLATDPTTGIVYIGDYNGNFYTLNTTTYETTFVGTSSENYIESGDFDSNGVFWFTGNGPTGIGLLSLSPSDLTTVTSYGTYLDPSDTQKALFALFVQGTPKPALASTGTDAGALLPIGIGAGILLVAGAAALVVARRRATS